MVIGDDEDGAKRVRFPQLISNAAVGRFASFKARCCRRLPHERARADQHRLMTALVQPATGRGPTRKTEAE